MGSATLEQVYCSHERYGRVWTTDTAYIIPICIIELGMALRKEMGRRHLYRRGLYFELRNPELQ